MSTARWCRRANATCSFQDMFVMDDALKRDAFRVKSRILMRNAHELQRGIGKRDKMLAFEQYMGKRLYDLVGTGAGLYLLSQRIIDVLESNRFTGWCTFEANIYDRSGGKVEGYKGLCVTGRCGPIDDSRSTIVTHPAPTPEGRAYRSLRGLFFDEQSWDGSDIFGPETTWHIIVTRKVKEALTSARVTNIRFCSLVEDERPLV